MENVASETPLSLGTDMFRHLTARDLLACHETGRRVRVERAPF